MKINELIVEEQEIDEGVGSFLGKAAGNVVGGLGAAWKDAKQGYKDAKAAWDPKDPPGTYNNAAPGSVPASPQTAATAPAADPTAPQAAAPQAAAPQTAAPQTAAADITGILQTIDKLDTPSKQQLASELEKNISTAATPAAAPAATPQGTTYDPAKAAADKLAKGQADQQQAQQQMATTAQANTATAQQDAGIKAAADAAKAKPAFQQTAADKLAIKAAADKGIREAKEKKKQKVSEFRSNFLGMMI